MAARGIASGVELFLGLPISDWRQICDLAQRLDPALRANVLPSHSGPHGLRHQWEWNAGNGSREVSSFGMGRKELRNLGQEIIGDVLERKCPGAPPLATMLV